MSCPLSVSFVPENVMSLTLMLISVKAMDAGPAVNAEKPRNTEIRFVFSFLFLFVNHGVCPGALPF
jgi:hypothetical protein